MTSYGARLSAQRTPARRPALVAMVPIAGSSIAAGWNGTSWTLQHTASPAGSTVHLLGSVSCAQAGGCTAVGDYATPAGGLTLAEAGP